MSTYAERDWAKRKLQAARALVSHLENQRVDLDEDIALAKSVLSGLEGKTERSVLEAVERDAIAPESDAITVEGAS